MAAENTGGPSVENWEAALEDAAQVAALALDRAQALADGAVDFWKSRPVIASIAAAAAGGEIGRAHV